ncbi:MAG: glycoside hydrolase family 20 zincin-like fold domain-containing protein [Chloroflexota bacterium]|nr:glycoside hydrolase family 20 zincin-like fold domain-containing protein [Chloroflexota bacterium]
MTEHLLPQPKELSPLDGTFSLNNDTLIVIPSQADDDTLFAAGQLQDEVCQATCLTLPIVKAFSPPRSTNIILLICGEEQAAPFGVEPVIVGGPEAVAAQAYALAITPTRVTLYAGAPTGLFYAVQTLRQLVRLHISNPLPSHPSSSCSPSSNPQTLPALAIQDWPTLPYRGLMLDISRRKVPTLATLKQLTEELGHYKLNVLQLYTEHTFQFPRHPKIGAGCGSLSSQDILELDIFCRQHHVELMPNLQSFGHARNTLTIPEYRHLAETEPLWTLSPAFEETYTLLDELYADILPAFTSTTFNVDCDETYDLGKGASKSLAEEIGVGRVYLNHILRLRELAARYGRHIQVWGDILLHHPELISEMPDDVVLLDWHYSPADEYPSIGAFAEARRRFWVCPGVGSWNSVFPRLYGANVNIRNFVRDGVAAGAEGMLNTEWGDHGHYQPLGLSWYGYVFGAAQGWSGGTTTDEDFEAAFGPLFLGPAHERILEAIHQLANTNNLPNVHRPNRSHTILALFDEPLTGATVEGEDALPAETLATMRALAEQAAATVRLSARGKACYGLASGHPRELMLSEMGSAARLTGYAARKVTLSQEIRRGLRDPGLDANRVYEYILALKALDAELETLRAEFESLWLAHARRSEMHVALGYYANLRARYRAAIDWLEGQRQALLKGQTVDADLTTYDASDYRTLWQNWPD